MHVFSVQNPQNKKQKTSRMVGKIKEKYDWYFSKLKCKKTGAANEIRSWTSTHSNNNVFIRKETRKKVAQKKFRRFQGRGNVWLMFWTPNDTVKGKSYVFSGDKQRNNVCLVYLECKLQEDI